MAPELLSEDLSQDTERFNAVKVIWVWSAWTWMALRLGEGSDVRTLSAQSGLNCTGPLKKRFVRYTLAGRRGA